MSAFDSTKIQRSRHFMLAGKAPSKYLAQIQDHAQVQLPDDGMDEILRTHFVDPALLRADNFEEFFAARKAALLAVVEQAMGKSLARASGPVAEDDSEDEDDESEDAP
jgi:hypothetical protein